MAAPDATVLTPLGQLPPGVIPAAPSPTVASPVGDVPEAVIPPTPVPAAGAPVQTPVGPKGPNFDPTGTVPVAGSPADPLHPAQQAPPPGAAPPPQMPATAEDAAQRRYEADQKVADLADQAAKAEADKAAGDAAQKQKEADLRKAQLDEQAKEDARQQAGLAKATAERDKLRADVADFKFHNFWDTRTTGQKLLAGIGIILGGASTDPHHTNEAARSIDTAIAQEWDAQKAELEHRYRVAQAKGEDLNELRQQYQLDSGKLKLRQEQQLLALASETDALAARSKNQIGVLNAQKIAAEARALAEQHGQQGVKEIAEAHSQALKDLETQAQTAKALAQAGKTKRKGAGGGGGAGSDVAGLNDWLDAHPGASAGDQARAAKQYGIKVFGKPSETTLKSVLAQREVTKKDVDKQAAGEAKQAAANDKDTVRVGGTPIGLVPSGRGGAVAYGKLLEGYKDSIESVKDLLSWVEANPKKAAIAGTHVNQFDRAVLALQTTSAANATDATTRHEAKSLQNLGFLDADAIRTTLRHLEERDKAYRSDLRPLPGAKGTGGFANAPQGKTTKIQMPDGSIQEFDASGKRVK